MLGEALETGFEVKPEAEIALGQVIGWLDGSKETSDLFSVVSGSFTGGNPLLAQRAEVVHADPYGDGWLPDLLSTATVLHALACLERMPSAEQTEADLDFIDSLWTNAGVVHGNWVDEALDVEYTYYGLLALGHLGLVPVVPGLRQGARL